MAELMRKGLSKDVEGLEAENTDAKYVKAKNRILNNLKQKHEKYQQAQVREELQNEFVSQAQAQIDAWSNKEIADQKTGERRTMNDKDIETIIQRFENNIINQHKQGDITDETLQQKLDEARILRQEANLDERSYG